jgi:hypothetical protein
MGEETEAEHLGYGSGRALVVNTTRQLERIIQVREIDTLYGHDGKASEG